VTDHRAAHLDQRLTIAFIAGKGRGVVATARIAAEDVIEVAPVIVVDDHAALDHTVLAHYVYDWKPDASAVAVALGFGSLYNHSYRPNARYHKHYDVDGGGTLTYIALRDIEAGEEVCVNYNGDPADQSPLWFDVVGDGGGI
jgi:SET domain-containing protein